MTAQAITFGRVLRYALLPGVVPRVHGLFSAGFGPLALFIALVYRSVRLLPEGHPYLNPANIGRFGIMNVVAEAARHIHFNRRQLRQNNIDQMVVFVVILLALGLLAFQFITMLLALVVPSAMAFSFPGGPSFSSPLQMFDTPRQGGGAGFGLADILNIGGATNQPFYDISFIFLDRVFGIPGVFNSCIADGVANSCVAMGPGGGDDTGIAVNDPAEFPWPYHIALQGMFQFYSIGLLVVAMFLLIYFTIVVVIETAQTGKPFGKRFDTVWAPLRLVTAAGLLIPISFGMNAGQYIALYAAKAGANFATNGWIGFNSMIVGENTMAGSAANLIAKPQIPDITQLLTFITAMQACVTIEDEVLGPATRTIAGGEDGEGEPLKREIHAYQVRQGATGNVVFRRLDTSMPTYADAVDWAGQGDVIIRIGIQDDEKYKDELGTVHPFCGEVRVQTVVYPNDPTAVTPPGTPAPAYIHAGASSIMQNYWGLLIELLSRRTGAYDVPNEVSGATEPTSNLNELVSQYYANAYVINKTGTNTVDAPTPTDREEMVKFFNQVLRDILSYGLTQEQNNATKPFQMKNNFLLRGWAAAGIWYNRIAEMNGVFTSASWNLPRVTLYPETMMMVAESKQATQVSTSPNEIFSPFVQNTQKPITLPRAYAGEDAAATAYWKIYEWWQQGGPSGGVSTRTAQQGNPILDLINFMFGTSGLFSIRQNANVHPLAQLSSIGKSLIERSITLLNVGIIGAAALPWISNLPGKKAVEVISGFAFSVLSIGASAGFILYYIIPFLPFIYFFFAVAGWVKAIFEAMIGIPLWALAHIRIDGSGLPSDAAMGGYFMILEIMLRPILIIFGLIASINIYAASVHMLNDVFNLAVANVTGIDMDEVMATTEFTMENLRGTIDTFFYTVLYVILVYMLGMSSFKLIDLIPGSMMRWMGASVTPFTDSGEGAAGQLVGYGTMGSSMVFGQLSGAVHKGASGISQVLKATADKAKGP